MNIENIAALSEQLLTLGFENNSLLLIKRISFKPKQFSLLQKIRKANEKICFQLSFEKDVQQELYRLIYYDAVLEKETPSTDTSINGIDTAKLEKSMAEIDWKKAFDFITNKQVDFTDKTCWQEELKVEEVIEQLTVLNKVEEGKMIAAGLKSKYWAGISNQALFGNTSPLKSNSAITQRFYFIESQTGISVDEAVRFLQNRWLEKEMQANKKELVKTNNKIIAESPASSNNKLLKRKRLLNTGNLKLTK